MACVVNDLDVDAGMARDADKAVDQFFFCEQAEKQFLIIGAEYASNGDRIAEISEKGRDVDTFAAGVRLLPGDAVDRARGEVWNARRLIDRGVQRNRYDARCLTHYRCPRSLVTRGDDANVPLGGGLSA